MTSLSDTKNDTAVLKSLSGAMYFVGVMVQLFGLLRLIAGLQDRLTSTTTGVIEIVEGALMLVVGGWLYRAATSFSAVVKTQDADHTHLTAALRRLRNVYVLQAVVIGVICLLFIAALVIKMRS